MGGTSSKTIVVIGLDGSGKSLCVDHLCEATKTPLNRAWDAMTMANTGVYSPHTLTATLDARRVHLKPKRGYKWIVWDLSGKKHLREMWSVYYSKADAIIFVIDVYDIHRSHIVERCLQDLMQNLHASDNNSSNTVPVLILANSRSSVHLEDGDGEDEIQEEASISTGVTQGLAKLNKDDLMRISCVSHLRKSHPCQLLYVDAFTGAGINQAVEWLSVQLH